MQTMNINAVSGCQPIKPTVPAVPLREISFKNSQSAPQEKQQPNNLEAKYDFACRLAAFYKKQYEDLKSGKPCYI